MSISGLLGLVLVVCKLQGWITWPWLWVLCPIWIYELFLVIGQLFCALIWACTEVYFYISSYISFTVGGDHENR